MKKYIQFCIGGGIAFLVSLGITILLTEVLKIKPSVSYAIGLLLSLLVLFIYQSWITFQHAISLTRFVKFMIIYSLSTALVWVLVFISIRIGLHYIASITIISILFSIVNYSLVRGLVFTKQL